MTPNSLEPAQAVLDAFGVTEPVPLDGRVRSHWAVRRGGERLVLTRHGEPEASVRYELRALCAAAEAGWPVPQAVAGPVSSEGWLWTLAPFLPGEPSRESDEPARRGRLLAEFHGSLDPLPSLGERPGFRRAEGVLDDAAVEATLRSMEGRHPQETALVRWHLERARVRLEGIDLAAMPGRLVHGDFTLWNLRHRDGRLSAILDFELAREDHRVAEFNLAWRGRYDAVILAYDEVSPLSPGEWAVLTPLWWLFLVDVWCETARREALPDAWALGKLRERTALMGPDRNAHPP